MQAAARLVVQPLAAAHRAQVVARELQPGVVVQRQQLGCSAGAPCGMHGGALCRRHLPCLAGGRARVLGFSRACGAAQAGAPQLRQQAAWGQRALPPQPPQKQHDAHAARPRGALPHSAPPPPTHGERGRSGGEFPIFASYDALRRPAPRRIKPRWPTTRRVAFAARVARRGVAFARVSDRTPGGCLLAGLQVDDVDHEAPMEDDGAKLRSEVAVGKRQKARLRGMTRLERATQRFSRLGLTPRLFSPFS